MVKVIRSYIQIAITPPRIARLRSNVVKSFITSQTIHYEDSRSKVKGQGQGHGSKFKITASGSVSAIKRSKTPTDRLSDLKLGMCDEIKANRDCAASG